MDLSDAPVEQMNGGSEMLVGREPPHSIELEQTLLALLLDGRHATAIHIMRQHAEHPLVFYRRDHRLIYQACLNSMTSRNASMRSRLLSI